MDNFFSGKTLALLAVLGGGWWWWSKSEGQANYGYLPAGSANHDCGCGG